MGGRPITGSNFGFSVSQFEINIRNAQDHSPDEAEAQDHSADATDPEGEEEEDTQEEDEETPKEPKGDDSKGRRKQVTEAEAQDHPKAPGKPPMARRSSGPLPKDKAVPKDKVPKIPKKKK